MDYLLTFFFLMAAHNWTWGFMPWRMPHPIRLIMNYVIGTVGMLAPFVYWLFERGEKDVIWKLLGFIVAAGLAPVFTHAGDAMKMTGRRAGEAEERERLLKEQRDAKG